MGQGGDTWVPTALSLEGAFRFIHRLETPYSQLWQGRAGSQAPHCLPAVCSLAPELLWKHSKVAWRGEGVRVNMPGPFLGGHLEACSYFLSDSRNQSAQCPGEGPEISFTQELAAASRSTFPFLTGKLPEMVFPGLFIVLTEVTPPSSGALWTF